MKKNIPAFIVSLALLSACSKDLPVKSLSFTAAATNTTLQLGDTAIFNFTGEPDFISFYSGETGHRYAYRNRTTAEGKPVLSFTSARANGNQSNSLQLMISSSFTGVKTEDTAATVAAIQAGNWTDITSRAILSTGSAKPSGEIDLSDFAGSGKPVYIAFRHNGYKGSAYSKWTITEFEVTNNLPDNTSYLIANMAAPTTEILNYGVSTYSPGFVAATVTGPYKWVISGGKSLVITGATSPATATDDSENWAIIGPIDLRKVTPDLGLPIKMISENMEKFPFKYQYPAAGSYEATFEASNANAGGVKSAVQSVKITVNE